MEELPDHYVEQAVQQLLDERKAADDEPPDDAAIMTRAWRLFDEDEAQDAYDKAESQAWDIEDNRDA